MVSLSPAKEDKINIDESFKITKSNLRVNINIDVGEVEIKKNSDSDECRVSIDYNPDYCESDIRFNERRSELDVLIDFENWSNWKDDKNKSKAPVVIIELPSESVLDLRTKLKAGEFDLELGGLKLENFEFNNWAGEAKINFNEPNKIEMETLDINFKVGELRIWNLGNARFNEADINSGIGELEIDFSGIQKTIL